MDTAKTLHLLETEEGFRPTPYTDSQGKRTIGIGYNLTARGNPAWWNDGSPWTHYQAEAQLSRDVAAITSEMDRLWPKWRSMTDARQAVCISGIFQLGLAGACAFHQTITAIEAGDYVMAAHQMSASLWAHQTPERAERAEQMMLTGNWLS